MSSSHSLKRADISDFRYEGRIDWSDEHGPVLVWQGTTVETKFDGESLVVCFGFARGICFFDLEIDDVSVVIEVREGAGKLKFSRPLGEGTHKMRLFKRTEAAVGHVTFLGIETALGKYAPCFASTEKRGPAFQFFGDSITAGACSEDGAVDQWDNYATHNNAAGYAALTAKAFDARYRNVAVSGMGVAAGYTPFVAAEIWDRRYADPHSEVSDEKGWAPHVVFVNYGENDDSFTRNNGLPFPADFKDRYVTLVQTMRKAYPLAELVLLRGGMWGGAKSDALREAWQEAVRQLQSGDRRLHSFVFEHWSDLHPRVSDHRAMADELIAWLKAQPFVQRYLV